MNKTPKDISQFKEIKQINANSVTYLFKLNDERLCVCSHERKMEIFKYVDNTFIQQLTIPNYTYLITKIIQIKKNNLITFPTDEGDINFVKILDDSYEIQYKIKKNNKIFKNFQKYISFIELTNSQIAVLVDDFDNHKILFYKYDDNSFKLITILNLQKKKYRISLDIIEIPKLNLIAYYSNIGLYFYDLKNLEIKKSIENINGFEWNNTMILYKDDYLILGSMYASCNDDDKTFYLIKCSTYELIDSYLCKELDFMFCTAIKILNDNTILCGFHMYDGYSKYVHIKIEDEKIKIIGIKRLSNNEFDGEICGIEQYNDIIVAGNRNRLIYLYK